MVDIVSIIIAVVSLLGSLSAAAFSGYISFYLDNVKRSNDAKALIHKYRDPLTLAAYDLQSRLYGIIGTSLLTYVDDPDKKDMIYVYTAFLVGQYLSWVYILHRQAQFLRFSTDKTNEQLNKIIDAITQQWSYDGNSGEDPFMLWRGEQMAIGECMTLLEEGGQLYCMGFAAFSEKYQSETTFKKWFKPIEQGISRIVEAEKSHNPVATFRLRRLQHLLIDMVLLLGSDRVKSDGRVNLKVPAAHDCSCINCPRKLVVESRLEGPTSKLPV